MKRIIILLLILSGASTVLAHAENNSEYGIMGMHHMMLGYGHNYYGFGFLGILFSIIFWAAIIYLIYWLIKRASPGAKKQADTPLNILKKRYAKGELTKKQYGDMKKELLK